ncbi:hypothetical protein SAMN05660337_2508 [Maridesulfovibrio ferrireducens]|uniref:Glycine-zipper containing OmpA-like membrane domain-containing protein n=1 Tax=Maridesulfovibrio ferrireducens TaxID=246191 RepID=A0A1G9IAI7_9BACT|nr:hypothetical protein [Maridesulfovibrio ferrireducens]SDL22211.1 hypothetical protein SAMN05660337_2508 [Maridesulfovibrio ferrireducens]
MFHKTISFLLFLVFIFACPACAKKPAIYPNDHSKAVGKAQTNQDIQYCLKLADDNVGKESRGKKSVKTGLKGGLVGGAIGLGIGIVTGSPGTSALAGAAGGSAGGAVGGAVQDNTDAVYRNFVEKCLIEKGYEPIGWR